MKVRFATLEDLDQVLVGALDFIERAGVQEFVPLDAEKIRGVLQTVLCHESALVVVAEHEGRLVSGLGLVFAPFLWNPDRLMADELFWWAATDTPQTAPLAVLRKAIQAVKDAAGDGTCVLTLKSLDSSPEGVGRVYEKLGLKKAETAYIGVF